LTGGRFGRVKLALSEDQILRLWERFRPMAPELFARRAVDAVLRNQAVIVLPRWWKALWYLDRLSPSLSLRLWEAMHQRLDGRVRRGGRPGGAARGGVEDRRQRRSNRLKRTHSHRL
jgi:hypothetical protein